MKRPWPRKDGLGRLAFVTIVVAIVLAAAAAIVSQIASSTSGKSVDDPPTRDDMAGIQSCLAMWMNAEYPSLPAGAVRTASKGRTLVRYRSFEGIPESWRRAEHRAYTKGVAEALDPTFAASSGYGDADPVFFMKEQMSHRAVSSDGLPVAWEQQILEVEYRCTLANGDVVVWERYWTGERRVFTVTRSGVAQRMRSVDNLSTDEYVLRRASNGWRIVGFAAVDYGPDASGDYGPDTPHGHEYTYSPQDVHGWAPGPTPAPGSTVMPSSTPLASSSPEETTSP